MIPLPPSDISVVISDQFSMICNYPVGSVCPKSRENPQISSHVTVCSHSSQLQTHLLEPLSKYVKRHFRFTSVCPIRGWDLTNIWKAGGRSTVQTESSAPSSLDICSQVIHTAQQLWLGFILIKQESRPMHLPLTTLLLQMKGGSTINREAHSPNGIAVNVLQKTVINWHHPSSLNLVGLAKINTEMWTDQWGLGLGGGGDGGSGESWVSQWENAFRLGTRYQGGQGGHVQVWRQARWREVTPRLPKPQTQEHQNKL